MAKSFDQLVKRTMTQTERRRASRRAKQMLSELMLAELRRMAGMTQAQLAEALGVSQASVSKLERRKDMQISTLQRIVEALGGELEITVKFPRHRITVSQFNKAA